VRTADTVLVKTDDWIVIYSGGVSVWSGHSIDAASLLRVLGVPYAEYYEELPVLDNDAYYETSWFQNARYDEGQPLDLAELEHRVNEGLMTKEEL
jgi:hypothetical protein